MICWKSLTCSLVRFATMSAINNFPKWILRSNLKLIFQLSKIYSLQFPSWDPDFDDFLTICLPFFWCATKIQVGYKVVTELYIAEETSPFVSSTSLLIQYISQLKQGSRSLRCLQISYSGGAGADDELT